MSADRLQPLCATSVVGNRESAIVYTLKTLRSGVLPGRTPDASRKRNPDPEARAGLCDCGGGGPFSSLPRYVSETLSTERPTAHLRLLLRPHRRLTELGEGPLGPPPRPRRNLRPPQTRTPSALRCPPRPLPSAPGLSRIGADITPRGLWGPLQSSRKCGELGSVPRPLPPGLPVQGLLRPQGTVGAADGSGS